MVSKRIIVSNWRFMVGWVKRLIIEAYNERFVFLCLFISFQKYSFKSKRPPFVMAIRTIKSTIMLDVYNVKGLFIEIPVPAMASMHCFKKAFSKYPIVVKKPMLRKMNGAIKFFRI